MTTNRLTVAEVESILSNDFFAPKLEGYDARDAVNLLAQQLLDTMRENERLRELLRNAPQAQWSDAFCKEVAQALSTKAPVNCLKHGWCGKGFKHDGGCEEINIRFPLPD
jgi:hypothetical protein